MKLLIQQSYFLNLIFFIPISIGGILIEDYSWIGQHGSEIALSENPSAILLLNIGAIGTGLSCLLFALALGALGPKSYPLSAVLLGVWGLSLISNGIFPIGNPMHGIYGIGLSLMLLPFAASYEFKGGSMDPKFYPVTILAGFLIFIYFWAYMVGLDPLDYRGLSQRIASLIIFTWISFFAYQYHKSLGA